MKREVRTRRDVRDGMGDWGPSSKGEGDVGEIGEGTRWPNMDLGSKGDAGGESSLLGEGREIRE